jgi:hypothetical protein
MTWCGNTVSSAVFAKDGNNQCQKTKQVGERNDWQSKDDRHRLTVNLVLLAQHQVMLAQQH